jgi:hypothetical protein
MLCGTSGLNSLVVAARGSIPPTDNATGYFGFRLALVPDPDAPAADIASVTSAAPASTGFFNGIISGVKSLWDGFGKK